MRTPSSAHMGTMTTANTGTLSANDQKAFASTALKLEAEHGLGDPIAVIRVYPGEGNFLTGGTHGRDHASISKTLIQVAGTELKILAERGQK